jgi:hypothetical protein
VILAIAAALAIVVQDHTALRAAPRSSAPELTHLGQGELLEVRGQSAEYLKVYDYHRERGGYLRSEAVRRVALTPADAPQLLAVLRFLRDTPGSEALGISYGAAYLKAAPATALSAEPLDAIARMAERLADRASGGGPRVAEATAHLDVVGQFGVHTRGFEQNGQMRVCYDGEMYRQVLALPGALAEERADAALGLTRPDCVDPDLTPLLRAAVDTERARLLDGIADDGLSVVTHSRLSLRRATVWATIAYEQARAGISPAAAAHRALDALQSAPPGELGDDRRAEYVDALIRVSAIRWAAAPVTSQTGPLVLTATAAAPGQTCLSLAARERPDVPLVRRCTYGIVWLASAQAIAQGHALVLAVQPLPSWRELWVFHVDTGTWRIDVLSPGAETPEQGYVDFAGFADGTNRLLIAREAREHGNFRRRFEELRLDDLVPVRQASTPDLLLDFRRWQDSQWRRETLALR